jgi:hypothetical protein
MMIVEQTLKSPRIIAGIENRPNRIMHINKSDVWSREKQQSRIIPRFGNQKKRQPPLSEKSMMKKRHSGKISRVEVDSVTLHPPSQHSGGMSRKWLALQTYRSKKLPRQDM